MKVKQQVSTPIKIKNYFLLDAPPSGSKLDEEILIVAFSELKKRFGHDFRYYIVAEAKEWASMGGSYLTPQDVERIFINTEPAPAKKKVKVDKFEGMSPIPFDPVWVDCGGPVD